VLDFSSVLAWDILSYALTMRDLNEIITRNAKRFIAEAQKSAIRDEGRELSEHMIAGRMAEAMSMKQDSVRKQLDRILYGDSVWSAPYIQGLATALGKPEQDLISLDPAASKVSEATAAQALYAGLNHRLSLKDTRGVTRRLQRQLDHPPLFNLIQGITDRLLDASNRADAYEAAMDLIRKSDAFTPKRRELHSKKIQDKKSK